MSAGLLRRVETMRKLALAMVVVSPLVISWPCAAQTQLLLSNQKGATAKPDNCAPIGRTAKGELVYSMKCDNMPAPPPPPPQAEVKEAPPPPPEPETRRSGLFGWSYDRRPDQ
jgi:hypothetical protein